MSWAEKFEAKPKLEPKMDNMLPPSVPPNDPSMVEINGASYDTRLIAIDFEAAPLSKTTSIFLSPAPSGMTQVRVRCC